MRTGLALSVATLSLIAACHSTGPAGPPVPNGASPTTGQPAESPTPSTPPRYDPPRQFDEDAIATAPLDAVIGISRVYSFAEQSNQRIDAIDLDGRPAWSAVIDGERQVTGSTGSLPQGLTVASGPAGGEQIYYVGVQLIQGSGTTQDRRKVALGALDGESGRLLWSLQVAPADGLDLERANVSLAGADEQHVIVDVEPYGIDEPPAALVVDVNSRTAAWTARGFHAGGLDGQLVLGLRVESNFSDYGMPQALDVNTRTPVWTGGDEASVLDLKQVAATPKIALFTVDITEVRTRLVAAATGRLLTELPSRSTCVYDRQNTLVCQDYDGLTGLDATSGKTLWSLRDGDANRDVPDLHAAYHGLVYTWGAHGGVILDARSGRDLIADAAVIPDAVIPGFGVVKESDGLAVHRATG
jgi:outer membrane protein assembly factor BamB